MKNILLIAAATAALLFTGCQTSGQPETAASAPREALIDKMEKAKVEKAVTTAESKYKKIKSMRTVVWRHTKKAIDAAKEALDKDDLHTAHKEAMKAIFEIDSALQQHKEASKTWQSAMPQALMQ